MKRLPSAGRALVVAGAVVLFFGPAVSRELIGPQSGSVREIKVRMSVGGTPSEQTRYLSFRPEFARMEALERRTMPGNLPRQRRPELSEDLLVVVAYNGRGEEVYRTGPVVDRDAYDNWVLRGKKSAWDRARLEVERILSSHAVEALADGPLTALMDVMKADARRMGVDLPPLD